MKGFVLVLVLFWACLAQAASFPKPQGYINDFANVLDQKHKAELQLIADKLQADQGIELAVAIIPDTSSLDPKEYATGLFREWGIGGPEDSGLLILLAVAEGAIEVEPGYGLEGTLPDGLIGAVIDQEGLSDFKQGNYGAGLVKMAGAYANILAGEKFELKKENQPSSGWLTSFIVFVLIVFLLRRNRRYPPSGTGGGPSGPIFPGPTTMGRGLPRGGSRPSGGFGGGRSGGGGAGRRF